MSLSGLFCSISGFSAFGDKADFGHDYLTAVEGYACVVWPDHMHVVVSMPDMGKGEQFILMAENSGADCADLLAYSRSSGIAEIMISRTILTVDQLPVLDTGKVGKLVGATG